MNKRENLLSILDPNKSPAYIPAAFFLHFPAQFHEGKASTDKHLEYFRQTDMDFVKVQFERPFPQLEEIKTPDDWAKMPLYGLDYYRGQLDAIEGLVKAVKDEAVIVVTLYSAFMCAAKTSTSAVLIDHLEHEPEKVRKGLDIINESLMLFVRACADLGVDGLYTSTQGGEAGRFSDPAIFEKFIKPYDLALMGESNQRCTFDILHVCDYELPYNTFSPFVDYPGQVINSPLTVANKPISPKQVAELFKRPYMGGLERTGTLATGTPDAIRQEVEKILSDIPERFILGADCTVPAQTPWENLKTAIDTAHHYQRVARV